MSLFVHESCAVAMHYRIVVPLYIVAVSFIPPARFHIPFVYDFPWVKFHIVTPPCFVCIIDSSMTFHQLDSHVVTPHFVCGSCALAMSFVCSHKPVLEIQSGLQDCQID